MIQNLLQNLTHTTGPINAYSLLASLYQTAREAIGVARRAGLPVEFIEAEGAAMVVWGSILAEARKRDMLSAIETIVKEDYPGVEIRPALRNLSQASALGGGVDFPLRGSDREYEKIIGSQPTFLPISFLEEGVARAKSVARIVCGDSAYGSGFLINKNLLVTNHHVLASAAKAENALVEFGYELDSRGLIRAKVAFQLDPERGFATSEVDDWTIVRVRGDANQAWGAIPVVAKAIRKDQFVNIIQHPGGGPKQIALYHNTVIFADNARVQYLTDTMPGSSGSPVFDSSWQLVAIHHAGGLLTRPGRPSVSFCNEGIAVNALLAGLAQVSLS